MSGTLDVGDLVSLLETSDILAGQQVKELILDNLRGTKEVWLVNTIVDSYVLSHSSRCLDIISAVSEPHDKHVFDRLLEHLRGPNKLSAMTILAALMYRQPPWLHKLIQHFLFNQILKCLKLDSDIPLLLSGTLVVTALLPVVPISIKEYLHTIFDVFSRLASLCLKTPGAVPEVYKYHLKVGVYCLHSRLYGMFPYHFLTYLRALYSKQDHQVFQHIIKPMIDKLRLHPLLFTTSRDKEVSIERWKHKEVHDILVECAQYSLDLTEGSTTEISTPGPQKMADHLVAGQKLAHAIFDVASPSPGSLVGGIDPATILSLQGTGIVTPPPGADTPTAGSHGQVVHASSTGQQVSALSSPAPESEKAQILANTEKFPARPATQKTESETLISQAAGTSTPAPARSSEPVPDSAPQEKSSEPEKSVPAFVGTRPTDTPLDASLDQSAAAGAAPPGVDLETAPSVSQLPKFLDTLDNQTGDTDQEVTVLTTGSTTDENPSDESCDTPSHLPPHLNTAESVAAFMKKVNRLRFNSINLMRDISSSRAAPKTERSRSCPTFEPEEGDDLERDQEEYRSSTLPKKKPRVPHRPPPAMNDSSQKKMTRCSSSQTSLYALSAAMLDQKGAPPPQAAAMVATETSTEADTLDSESPFERFPYQELFSLMLPFSPYVQCYSCVMRQSQEGAVTPASSNVPPTGSKIPMDDCLPLFTSYSPAELLDRILDQANSAHNHQQEQQQRVTTPGGKLNTPDLASSSDPAVLRGQIDMLHSQLMFERHKRELHAQRNRRLLSRIVKTTALQEENNAMKDQLLLQERELLILRKELTQQQKMGQQLRQATVAHEADTEKMQKSYSQKMETLQSRNKDIEAELDDAKVQQEKSNKDIQCLQANIYLLTKEVEALTVKAQFTDELKEQVKRLNKELLLMGELQQKYQSRLVALNTSESSSTHQQFLLETYKRELNTIKNNLSEKTMELNATEGLLAESKSQLEIKDEVVEDLKQMMESARDVHTAQLEAVDKKYQALKKSHLALQTEFLNLNNQIGCMRAAAERRSAVSTPRNGAAMARQVPVIDASGASTASDGQADWPGPDVGVGGGGGQDGLGLLGSGDCPAEWSAPASVSSVESAEEAVAMDTSQ